MSQKVWTEAEREAAYKVIKAREDAAIRATGMTPEQIVKREHPEAVETAHGCAIIQAVDLWEMFVGDDWRDAAVNCLGLDKGSQAIDLQCENSEARELLKVSEHDENSAMSQFEWDRRVTEFLDRNKESQ